MARRIGRWAAWGAGVVTIVLLLATYWLFYDGGPRAPGRYRLDLAAIRAEAARMRGPAPSRLEFEVTSRTPVPAIAMTSGTSWGEVELVRVAHRIVYPDRTVMIDTGDEEAAARRYGATSYDRAARTHILRALAQASAIVVTHEHGDHLGGALVGPQVERVARRLVLTAEQVGSADAPPWPAGVPRPAPIAYRSIRAIAPGVVLVKAPGHTPGSQMVYVRREDGREFLFLGDVASMGDNVRLGRQRSRYVTSWMQRADRAAVADQVAAIAAVAREVPALVLVPGHDRAALADLERRGLLRRGFR